MSTLLMFFPWLFVLFMMANCAKCYYVVVMSSGVSKMVMVLMTALTWLPDMTAQVARQIVGTRTSACSNLNVYPLACLPFVAINWSLGIGAIFARTNYWHIPSTASFGMARPAYGSQSVTTMTIGVEGTTKEPRVATVAPLQPLLGTLLILFEGQADTFSGGF
jgi:hypothetical protein